MSNIDEQSLEEGFATDHTESQSEGEMRSAILRSKSANPALQRLKGRLLADAEASEVITSYDRMHHRHNRS